MKSSFFKITVASACLSLVLGLGGCASSQNPDAGYKAHEIADPIEPINRFVFSFNDLLDRAIIEPVAKGYRAVVPSFIRDSIQSFMRNLNSPIIVANDLLQGKIGDAGVATARFVINSTVGVAGLVDVAQTQGFSYQDEDFGQTLAKWGVGDGFYLVLPVLGPSSLRDTTGLVVDSYADPVRIIAHNSDKDWIYYTREAIEGLDTRSRLITVIDDMRRTSFDYYAAAKSAYTQKRASLINDDHAGSVKASPQNDYPQ